MIETATLCLRCASSPTVVATGGVVVVVVVATAAIDVIVIAIGSSLTTTGVRVRLVRSRGYDVCHGRHHRREQ